MGSNVCDPLTIIRQPADTITNGVFHKSYKKFDCVKIFTAVRRKSVVKAQFWVSGVTSFSPWTFRMTLRKLAYLNPSGFQTVAYNINWPGLD